MELRDYFRVLRRRWISIMFVASLVTVVAAGLTAIQTPQFASTARLFVTTAQTASDAQLLQGGQFSAQRVKSYADLITSRELAQRVIDDTGFKLEPSDLIDRVTAAAVLETVNLEVTVTDPDAERAQALAQSYAEQLTDLVRELETPDGQSDAPIKATIVDAASRSDAPISPNPVRNVGLGLVLGLLLGFGVAVLREILDTHVKSPEDVAKFSDVATLGTIIYDSSAAKKPLLTEISSHSPRAESFRVLRTNLQFIDVDQRQKVFIVASSVPGEGKTSTAVNLAISLAQGGNRTLLVEGDLRRPMAAKRLGMDEAIGLTSVLIGKVTAADVVQTHQDSGLDFIASGAVPPNPAELIQSKAMDMFLAWVRGAYDIVIVDAPPLLPVTDSALLAAKADGALVVISHGTVTRDQVRHSLERLEQVDATVAGVVLNKVPVKGKSYGYGYGYGYAPTDGGKAT